MGTGRVGARPERRHYLFRQLAAHLAESGEPGRHRLFALIEKPGFLAEQAEECGGFGQSGEDVEQRALPAAIEAREWERFLHYALLATNLRGLAEAMAEGPVLQALARDHRFDIAEDAVARLSDPARRAAARAALAAACERGGERFLELLRRIEEDLEDGAGGPTLPMESLVATARHLSPDLAAHWPLWIERLTSDPASARRLAWAVAKGYIGQGRIDDPGLWQALAKVEPALLRAELPERLGRLDLEHPGAVLARLRELLGPEAFWLAAARLLARLAERVPEGAERALAAWEVEAAAAPVPWSADLAEAGWELFRRLPAGELERIAGRLSDPAACTALRVLALAAEPGPERITAALAAVSMLPDGPARLHWALRYLAVRPPEAEAERQFGAVLAYLRELRYDAEPADVARFLDLASRVLPRKALAREVEDAVFSPASRPETLRALAGNATAEPVLEELLDHAERYAAAVAPTEAEGFLLRGDLIGRVARRLCVTRCDLSYLGSAVERLMPEEEDALRAALAADLERAGLPDLAWQAAAGIGTQRLRLETQLPVAPAGTIADLLGDPARRYATLASVEAAEGERSALVALLDAPFDPRELAERCLSPIRDREVQTCGLLRLARHALAFEERFHRGRQDRAAVLELVRASLSVAADDHLVALTPEIAALGARRGGARAVAELQEAARRLLGLEGVDWSVRRDALEDLLARLGLVFFPAGGETRRACGQAAEVLRAILRLPLDLEPEAAREELRRHWDEVLPLLAAAIDRLPGEVARRLAGISRVWPGWESRGEPDGQRGLGLCLAGPDAWAAEADRLLASSDPDPAVGRVLVYLLAARAPGQAVDLLRRLPTGAERDGLCLRLLRHGWLPRGSRDLLAAIEAPEARLEGEIVCPLPDGDGSGRWLDALAQAVAQRGLDPCDPAAEPLLARLWSCDPAQSRPPLAKAVVAALRAGGRGRGEAAVRLWLHAHLAPRPGLEQRDKLDLAVRAKAALEAALSLPAEAR
jgi:hypothetical protein